MSFRLAACLALAGLLAACGQGGGGTTPSSAGRPDASTLPTWSARPLPPHHETTPHPSPLLVTPHPSTVPRHPVGHAAAPLFTDPANPPVIYRVPTRQPVVFLTVDDGWTQDPGFLRMVAQAGVPVTAFLVGRALQEAPAYWRSFVARGGTVQDHTLTHVRMNRVNRATQRIQVCRDADVVTRALGRRPTLFRPPYGELDANTLLTVRDCGLAAVVLWSVSVDHGRLTFAEGSQLRPGDVLLLHFTPAIRVDLAAALAAVRAAGLSVGALEDFVRPRPPATPTPRVTAGAV